MTMKEYLRYSDDFDNDFWISGLKRNYICVNIMKLNYKG